MTPTFFRQSSADCDAAMRQAIVSLWRTAFGDGEDFVRTFLAQSGAEGFFFLRDGAPRLCAMLFRLPLSAENRTDGRRLRGGYLYAVATDPAFRGQGLCRRLLGLAEEGMDFLTLIPADDGLYEAYHRMGFTVRLETRFPLFIDRRGLSSLLLPPGLPEPDAPPPPAGELYADMRRYLRPGDLLRSEAFFRLAVEDCGAARLKGGGWLVFDKSFSGNTIKIYEMYCPFETFSAIMKQYGGPAARFGLLRPIAPGLLLTPGLGLYLQ